MITVVDGGGGGGGSGDVVLVDRYVAACGCFAGVVVNIYIFFDHSAIATRAGSHATNEVRYGAAAR